MMLEYIFKTGAFGIIWVINIIMFVILSIRFWKKPSNRKYPQLYIGIFILFFMFNQIAIDLLEHRPNELMLQIIRDSWLLIMPSMYEIAYMKIDKNLFNNKHNEN